MHVWQLTELVVMDTNPPTACFISFREFELPGESPGNRFGLGRSRGHRWGREGVQIYQAVLARPHVSGFILVIKLHPDLGPERPACSQQGRSYRGAERFGLVVPSSPCYLEMCQKQNMARINTWTSWEKPQGHTGQINSV